MGTKVEIKADHRGYFLYIDGRAEEFYFTLWGAKHGARQYLKRVEKIKKLNKKFADESG